MPYCAPEIMRPFNINNITPAYDIFSFGVILFELIFERNPFVKIKNYLIEFLKLESEDFRRKILKIELHYKI